MNYELNFSGGEPRQSNIPTSTVSMTTELPKTTTDQRVTTGEEIGPATDEINEILCEATHRSKII